MSPITLLARKEAGELLLSSRGLTWLLAVALALSAFGLLLVSDTELSLLDNAQVVYDMTGILTALGALLAVVVGIDAIAGPRAATCCCCWRGARTGQPGAAVACADLPDRHPVRQARRPGYRLVGDVGDRDSLPLGGGQHRAEPAYGILALALLGTPVVLGFGFFAMGLASRLGSARSSLITGLITLLVSASPLLLGPSLRQSVIGRLFDAVNPFSGALNAYDAVIIDSQTIVAQTGHLAQTLLWLALALWFAATGFRKLSR